MTGLLVQMGNAGVHFWRNVALLVIWGIGLCWTGAALLRMRAPNPKSPFLSWLQILAVRGQTAALLIIGIRLIPLHPGLQNVVTDGVDLC